MAYEDVVELSNTTESGTNVWHIANTMISAEDYILQSGSEVHFVTGGTISLNSGFRVSLGAKFVASIGSIGGYTVSSDEEWEGNHYISGDLVIESGPDSPVLDIQDESIVTFLDGGVLIVEGELLATGTIFTSTETDIAGSWVGIQSTGTLTLIDCTVKNARQGVSVHSGTTELSRTLFWNNLVGFHVFAFENKPILDDCTFDSNLEYAIKEDSLGDSQVLRTTFEDNGHLYYDTPGLLLTIDSLNNIPGNWDNREE